MNKITKLKKNIPLSKLNPRCAGIDIGAKELFVCIAKSSTESEIRSFSTFTVDLKQMIDWLKKSGVKSVAMESTSVYWIVPYEMLEEAGLKVLLVNPSSFKNVPGRKTDVQDCQWIQQLHSYGLLRGSFRPSNDFVELRSYVRQRSSLFKLAATQAQLMHKALVQMNIQLNQVIRDITGVTGLNIIRAILNAERDPSTLAELSVGVCRKNREEIKKSLEGNFRKEHLLALQQSYEGYEFFHQQVKVCEEHIERKLSLLEVKYSPFAEKDDSPSIHKYKRKTLSNRSPYFFNAPDAVKKIVKADLTTIPGIDANTAMKIVSEIGLDLSKWPNSKAFASWLGLSPGNKISGGKILSSKTKRSNNKVAHALRMAANSLYRSKTGLGAFFRRMRARLGAPKAITATAHKLARIIYRMIVEEKEYREVGENYYEQQYQARVLANLTKRAKEMGYVLMPAK